MKKEDFDNYEGDTFYCKDCGQILPKRAYSYSMVHKNGTGRCRLCAWIKQRGNIPHNTIATQEQTLYILKELFYNDETIINDLSDKLNLSIENIMDIIHTFKLGNKKYSYRYNCEYCGKQCYTNPQKYLDNHYLYCSSQCYWNDKPNKIGKGEDNICYNRITTHCTNCNKEIKVIPSSYNSTNRFNDNHNFCSHECYWEYRSKYYVGDKCVKRVCTPELRDKFRKICAKRLSDNKRLDTKIQLKVNSILDSLKINYEREYNTKYYAIDNYLTDCGLMIEVQGDYWHSNPLKFNEYKYKLNNKQFDGIHRDKLKHSYIKNHYNIEILYLWENDINTNEKLCRMLISEYVHNHGILSNYHSFNYEIFNGCLKLKDDLMIPYQDMPCSEYKRLIKNPA